MIMKNHLITKIYSRRAGNNFLKMMTIRRFYCAKSLPNIKFIEKGTCGIIQLDRPKVLNAISREMFK